MVPWREVVRDRWNTSGSIDIREVCAHHPLHRPVAMFDVRTVVEYFPRLIGHADFVVCGACGEVLGGPGISLRWRFRLWWTRLLASWSIVQPASAPYDAPPPTHQRKEP